LTEIATSFGQKVKIQGNSFSDNDSRRIVEGENKSGPLRSNLEGSIFNTQIINSEKKVSRDKRGQKYESTAWGESLTI